MHRDLWCNYINKDVVLYSYPLELSFKYIINKKKSTHFKKYTAVVTVSFSWLCFMEPQISSLIWKLIIQKILIIILDSMYWHIYSQTLLPIWLQRSEFLPFYHNFGNRKYVTKSMSVLVRTPGFLKFILL